MKNFLSLFCISLLALSFVFVACDRNTPGKEESKEHKHVEGEKHDHENVHEDDHQHGHEHEGKSVDLEKLTLDNITIAITQNGNLQPGGELAFEIALSNVKEAPAAVRGWVGIENAQGSVKSLASKEEGPHYHYDLHVEIPKNLPEGSRFWIEIEKADGKIVNGSVACK